MRKDIVTRDINGELETYVSTNWNHVACLIATEKIVSWEELK